MYILGIAGYYHDSAACLLKDGVIVAAAQEERFSRIKNDPAFPAHSIRYCLAEANISLNEVDFIAYYEKPFLKFERLLETYLAFAPKGWLSFMKAIPLWLRGKLLFKRMLTRELLKLEPSCSSVVDKLLFSRHHLSHAASAYYPSPFLKAVILTVDGVGEWETTTVSIGEDNRITPGKHLNFPHSLGLLYSAFTYYLGFKVNCDEYKVMGLAPYGQPVYSDLILKELIDVKPDGSFQLHLKYFEYPVGLKMTGKAFDRLFGRPARKPSEALEEFHINIAASVQQVTEQVMLKITQSLYQEYGIDNLCLAGGVALNCVINAKILKQSGFDKLWVQPAAGDAGGALGAAYSVYYQHLANERIVSAELDSMQNALLGPAYNDDEEILRVLKQHNLVYERFEEKERNNLIASKLAQGQVVGYFSGRMEFGPRALGARSILADPRNEKMQRMLNLKIKFRESFRPFAPAVLEEHAGEYFDLDVLSPYMLMVGKVVERKRIGEKQQSYSSDLNAQINQVRSVIQAVTHVDYSARLQTVSQTNHPDFYRVISAFYELTGCPMLVNTSFNRMDEPIVCSPEDAVHCFLNTDIDVLVINQFVILKKA